MCDSESSRMAGTGRVYYLGGVHEHKSPMTLAVVSGIFNVPETAAEEAAELQTLTEQMLRWRGLERQVSGF